jgi:Cytochrome P460
VYLIHVSNTLAALAKCRADRFLRRRKLRSRPAFIAMILACAVLSGAVLNAPRASSASDNDAPQYDAAGQLKFPTGFERWIFVGSNLGLGYAPNAAAMTTAESQRADQPKFHNIYINPDAYDAFLKSGTFPDRTVLVMAVYAAADKEPRGIVAKGVFNGAPIQVEAAVKNLHRPDGATTDWAYYSFPNLPTPTAPTPVAAAHGDGECYACHKVHASIDNVWVQFYPILRDR